MSAIKLPELPPEVDTVRVLFRGQPDHFEAQDYYYTQGQMRAYAEQAVREALEERAITPVADEIQALHDHDSWFREYGQTLGAFYNSLTIHTRAAWVAASKKYSTLASITPKENSDG